MNIPIIGTVINFITGKTRLFIEYILIGCVVALGCVVTSLWFQKNRLEGNLKQVENELVGLQIVNERQDETINTLQVVRKHDAIILSDMLDQHKKLLSKDAKVKEHLAQLEKKHAHVTTYLDTPIPVELVCLLDSTCETGNHSGANSN